jgi:hypothetical protein
MALLAQGRVDSNDKDREGTSSLVGQGEEKVLRARGQSGPPLFS